MKRKITLVLSQQEVADIIKALARKERFNCLCHCEECKQGFHEFCINLLHRSLYAPVLERNKLIRKINKLSKTPKEAEKK